MTERDDRVLALAQQDRLLARTEPLNVAYFNWGTCGSESKRRAPRGSIMNLARKDGLGNAELEFSPSLKPSLLQSTRIQLRTITEKVQPSFQQVLSDSEALRKLASKDLGAQVSLPISWNLVVAMNQTCDLLEEITSDIPKFLRNIEVDAAREQDQNILLSLDIASRHFNRLLSNVESYAFPSESEKAPVLKITEQLGENTDEIILWAEKASILQATFAHIRSEDERGLVRIASRIPVFREPL